MDAPDHPTPSFLAVVRVGIGVLFLIRTTGLATLLNLHVNPRATGLLGWQAEGPGFGALFAIPGAILAVACVLRTVAAVLFTVGVFHRAMGIVAALLAYLVATQDPLGFNMTMHVLFLGTLVLALADAGNRLALRPVALESPHSSFVMVRAWVASIYVWAGLAKLNGDWLSGRVLQTFVNDGVIHGPLRRMLFANPGLPVLLAPALAVGEIALGLLLVTRKTRRLALAGAYLLHACFEITLAPDLFGWTMAVLLIAFLGALDSRRPPVVYPRLVVARSPVNAIAETARV